MCHELISGVRDNDNSHAIKTYQSQPFLMHLWSLVCPQPLQACFSSPGIVCMCTLCACACVCVRMCVVCVLRFDTGAYLSASNHSCYVIHVVFKCWWLSDFWWRWIMAYHNDIMMHAHLCKMWIVFWLIKTNHLPDHQVPFYRCWSRVCEIER